MTTSAIVPVLDNFETADSTIDVGWHRIPLPNRPTRRTSVHVLISALFVLPLAYGCSTDDDAVTTASVDISTSADTAQNDTTLPGDSSVSEDTVGDSDVVNDALEADALDGADAADAPEVVDAPVLLAGSYLSGGIEEFSNTCQGFDLTAGSPELAWTSPTEFSLTFDESNIVNTCTVGVDKITCDPYSLDGGNSRTAVITMELTGGYIEVLSNSKFAWHDTLTKTCVGFGCGDLQSKECKVEFAATYKWNCSLAPSNCPGQEQKCVGADAGDGTTFFKTCKATIGSGQLGDPCERPEGVFGDDTCAPGLFCGRFGLPKSTPQAFHCVAYCESSDSCTEGTVCRGLNTGPVGACAPSCTPFEDSCGVEGLSCKVTNHINPEEGSLFSCDFTGNKPDYSACSDSVDCGIDASCRPKDGMNPTCYPYCDATHPCKDPAATCVDFTSSALAGFGSCQK